MNDRVKNTEMGPQVYVRHVDILPEEEGQRLDNYLLRLLKGVPKSHIYRIIRGGEVRVNKKRSQPATRLHSGDVVRIPPVRCSLEKTPHLGDRLRSQLEASIVYEDEALLVINKPSGVAVHGGSGVSLGVIEGLRQARSDLHYLELIHRLDKETSGCLLMAKKRSALRAIQALLVAREVKKIYWALLAHPWQGKQTITVDAPLKKNTLKSGERMVIVSDDGKSAQTLFTLRENYKEACWVEASPKTGRTHQIRVHSAYLNHPILGDEKYGLQTPHLPGSMLRLYLHARGIEFTLNGKLYTFQADPDERFLQTIHLLNLA